MKKLKKEFILFFVFAIILAASGTSFGIVPQDAKPIRAYQAKYDMFFSIWEPDGVLPAWFATFDGYPVREFQKNYWVYGIIGASGEITDSQILVGAADPRASYILRKFPQGEQTLSSRRGHAINSFWKILDSGCDRFSVIKTDASYTPVAWKNNPTQFFVWDGKQWLQLSPRGGESFAAAIQRESNFIAKQLRRRGVLWTKMDTLEMVDFVRTAGYIWVDDIYGFNVLSDDIFHTAGEANPSAGTGSPGEEEGGWDTGR